MSACPARPAGNRAGTGQGGFTYLALLAALIIIGITVGTVARYWSNVSARDKEEELLFRGDQYRTAIERYFYAIPGRREYPPSIDELLKDSRSAAGRRYLRQKFKDPMTGKDFDEIRDGNMRVVGVCSSSEKQPIKQANFDPADSVFEGKQKYSEWKFRFIAPAMLPPGAPGAVPVPGMPAVPPGTKTGSPFPQGTPHP